VADGRCWFQVSGVGFQVTHLAFRDDLGFWIADFDGFEKDISPVIARSEATKQYHDFLQFLKNDRIPYLNIYHSMFDPPEADKCLLAYGEFNVRCSMFNI